VEHPIIYWFVTAIVIVVTVVITVFNAKHWIGKRRFLCADCKFNTPEDCLKPERPKALECTAYRPESAIELPGSAGF
jgi:hypothetical protein